MVFYYDNTGYVRRIVELENDNVLVGCQTSRTSKVEQYVADKERIRQKQRLKKHKRY